MNKTLLTLVVATACAIALRSIDRPLQTLEPGAAVKLYAFDRGHARAAALMHLTAIMSEPCCRHHLSNGDG